jgi:hypothetical protein
MRYVIAEPCTGVTDRACAGEGPAGCLNEGERMLYPTPASASTVAAASRWPGRGNLSAKTTYPARGPSSPPETPNSPASSARPAAPPRPAPLPHDTDYAASYLTGR